MLRRLRVRSLATGFAGVAGVAITLGLGACASSGQAWRAGPAGIPAERELRAKMVAGQYGAALESLKDRAVAPPDAVLRHMYKGLVAMHAGQSELGTRALNRAWEIAYQRWTKRLGDAAQSMVTGEGALPYDPGPAERMLIPYYGGLNWLARNERAEAAVEARRMSVLLASDEGPMPDRQFQGVMRYIAGVMFEVAGERNDADVAYRNANVLLDGALPGDTVPPDEAHGDIVVLIEDGFVVRPEPARLDFWVAKDEVDLLAGDDDGRRMSTFHVLDQRRHERRNWSETTYRQVSIRWPTMEPGANDAHAFERTAHTVGARVWPRDSTEGMEQARTIGMSVSDAVRADFERRQPARLSRALARAAVREVSLNAAGGAFEAAGDILSDDDDSKPASKGTKAKKGKGDKGGKGSSSGGGDEDSGSGNGWLAAAVVLLGLGLFAVFASSEVLDQPDLRAWQLLPDRVTVARLRLPVGEHPVEVTRDGEVVSLGTVTVRPGSVTVLVHRWWPGDQRVLVSAPGVPER